MIAALYVEKDGAYFGLDDVDPWDEERDARLYAGPWAVVAHPPCARWCQLASVNEKRWGTKIGDDGGCFAAALQAVRRFGGVLEHPANSLAWQEFDLPRPVRQGWQTTFTDPGHATEVSQVAYGHLARKRTWLYAVNCELPDFDYSDRPGVALIGGRGTKGLPAGRFRMQDALASRTPPSFRDVLLVIARSALPSFDVLPVLA